MIQIENPHHRRQKSPQIPTFCFFQNPHIFGKKSPLFLNIPTFLEKIPALILKIWRIFFFQFEFFFKKKFHHGVKGKMTHQTIFISFLCDNVSQNLKFCPDRTKFMVFLLKKKSPLEKK